jgi:hypothetical protein
MIRFIIGFCTIVAAVGTVEGGGNFGTAILLATAGSMIMVWGASGMTGSGDVV